MFLTLLYCLFYKLSASMSCMWLAGRITSLIKATLLNRPHIVHWCAASEAVF